MGYQGVPYQDACYQGATPWGGQPWQEATPYQAPTAPVQTTPQNAPRPVQEYGPMAQEVK